MGVVGAIRSDSGLGMVGRSGRHWCAGIDRGAGSPHSTSSGQALRGRRDVVRLGPPKTPARLTMNGGYEYVGSGWWEVGVTLVRWDCWVLLGPGRGRRDDGGTEVGRRGLGAAWDVFSRSGECVQSVGPMCSVLGAMCPVWRATVSSFLAECVHSRGECVHFGGARCSVLGGAPWLGMGRGRKARFLGSAALRSE